MNVEVDTNNKIKTRKMKRTPSKNYTLFGLYMDEVGEFDLFDKVKRCNLRDLISYSEIYKEFEPENQIGVINSIRKHKGLDEVESVSEVDDRDMLSMHGVLEVDQLRLTEEEIEILKEVFEKIELYHATTRKNADEKASG